MQKVQYERGAVVTLKGSRCKKMKKNKKKGDLYCSI